MEPRPPALAEMMLDAESETFLTKQHTRPPLSGNGRLLRGTGKVAGRPRVFPGGMFCRPGCTEGRALRTGADAAAGLGGRTEVFYFCCLLAV